MRVNIPVLMVVGIVSLAHGQITSLQNAPFSGEMIETHVQTLADGTHITSPEQTTKFYRDSLGRTRSERYMTFPTSSRQTQPELTSVTIMDPVEGVNYFLSPRDKTARKVVIPKNPEPGRRVLPTGPTSQVALAPVPSGVIAFSGRLSAVAIPNGSAPPAGSPQSKNEELDHFRR